MQRDYILRLIEQAGTALKRLFARLEGGARHAELMADLQRTAQLGGLDIDLLRMCDAQGLLHVVAPTGEPDPSRTWLAAETLLVDARVARAAPTSRKLAGAAPAAFVTSSVAMASPAPLTRQPMSPSKFT